MDCKLGDVWEEMKKNQEDITHKLNCLDYLLNHHLRWHERTMKYVLYPTLVGIIILIVTSLL